MIKPKKPKQQARVINTFAGDHLRIDGGVIYSDEGEPLGHVQLGVTQDDEDDEQEGGAHAQN